MPSAPVAAEASAPQLPANPAEPEAPHIQKHEAALLPEESDTKQTETATDPKASSDGTQKPAEVVEAEATTTSPNETVSLPQVQEAPPADPEAEGDTIVIDRDGNLKLK
jgi:hypothetical protein